LPVADQLFDPSCGAFAKYSAVPYRQCIAEAAAELMLRVVRREAAVKLQVIWIQDRRRIVLGRGGKDAGIDIHHFRKRIIRTDLQPTLAALAQRHAASVVTGSA